MDLVGNNLGVPRGGVFLRRPQLVDPANGTFKSDNILDSQLFPGSSHVYTTASSYGKDSLETTKLISGLRSPTVCEISWCDDSFEIAGRSKKLTPAKGWFNSYVLGIILAAPSSSKLYVNRSRDWTWGGQVYTVQHSSTTGWTAKTPRGEVAHYIPPSKSCRTEPRTRATPSVPPVVSPKHAAIEISLEIQDQIEIVFLIFVMLYSETKRLEWETAAEVVAEAMKTTGEAVRDKNTSDEDGGGAGAVAVAASGGAGGGDDGGDYLLVGTGVEMAVMTMAVMVGTGAAMVVTGEAMAVMGAVMAVMAGAVMAAAAMVINY
ncbi:hypothetical protein C8J57DRAFT_1224047 [Mycena rebaudengoi]|nr:hypothetical protein C8J57DRAFT_1224047 [Mycena rebaudengoi]